MRRRSASAGAISAAAPRIALRRAGPAWATGVNAMARPPAAVAPDPAKMYGSSRWASCQAGTAVLAIRAAVYVASGGPNAAAPRPARRPSRGSRPVTWEAAAAVAKPLNGARMNEPTDSGEGGLKTRRMGRNGPG